jgi:hypothetical protein
LISCGGDDVVASIGRLGGHGAADGGARALDNSLRGMTAEDAERVSGL